MHVLNRFAKLKHVILTIICVFNFTVKFNLTNYCLCICLENFLCYDSNYFEICCFKTPMILLWLHQVLLKGS